MPLGGMIHGFCMLGSRLQGRPGSAGKSVPDSNVTGACCTEQQPVSA